MISEQTLFHSQFLDNKVNKTLVLLHGTGGTESDFFFLNEELQEQFNLLGLRGNISEQGANRFFKRLAENVFDQESLKTEAKKLQQFINAWLSHHNQTADDLVFLGYSNGANMILATLFYFPNVIKTAVLLHPLLPFKYSNETNNFSTHRLFITHGRHDPMVKQTQWQSLLETLQALTMPLVVKEYPGGHQLMTPEIKDAVAFVKAMKT